jgi:hypothetical protein
MFFDSSIRGPTWPETEREREEEKRRREEEERKG